MSAELADLKRRLNITSTSSDTQLQWNLDVATAKIAEHVYDADMVEPRPAPVDEAILMRAARLYARRNTPEGVASWAELGIVHIESADSDEAALLERHEDYGKAGIA